MKRTVAIVGGGPAGLAAATELRRMGVERVVVFERERDPGGIPRHCAHQGFGIRDLRSLLSGPSYARRRAQLAAAAGAEIRTRTTVTGWGTDGELELTSPTGRAEFTADAILLATGCRERPRSARLIPGTRPAGVMTTGTLQQLVHLRGVAVGSRAVVVGAEHVSFSALATLSHAGVRTVCMTTEQAHHQSFELFRMGARLRYGLRLRTQSRLTAIHGGTRVEAVELTDLATGDAELVGCDTVVLTADWIPDHELAALGGIDLDRATRGPAVDGALRTSRTGVFAAGNLLRGAETADVAALEGRHAARRIVRHLAGGGWPQRRLAINVQAPLAWITPNIAADDPTIPPRGVHLVRAATFVPDRELLVTQGDRNIWRGPVSRLQPGRSGTLPAASLAGIDPSGTAVEIRVSSPSGP